MLVAMSVESRLTPTRSLFKATHDLVFHHVHGGQLIYNACWEDPRIDRQLLGLTSASRVVMITSAGCNALDYLLDDPAEIHAVDVNPRQNAVLELKLALRKVGGQTSPCGDRSLNPCFPGPASTDARATSFSR